MSTICRLCLALFAALAITLPARAQNLDDPVAGHPKLRYADLARLVVMDLDATGAGHTVAPFRHIEGKGSQSDPEDDFTVTSVGSRDIEGDPSRLLLLVDCGPSEGNVASAVMLALVQLDPAPRLLDMVEVGRDRFTGFSQKSLPSLAPGRPLIVIDSSHSNADESYLGAEMMFVDGNRLRLIDSFFLLNASLCVGTRTQTPSYAIKPDAPGPAALQLSVLETITRGEADCGNDRPYYASTRTFWATYRWDPRKRTYVTRSRQVSNLSEGNMKRL